MAFEAFDPRPNAGNFLRYFELSPEQPTSYRARWDEAEGAVVIDLKEPVKSGSVKG